MLRGAGGIAIGLPFLEAMHEKKARAATPTPPKRFIVWYTSSGTVLRDWVPSTTGENFDIKPILKPLDTPTLRPKLTLVSGIKMGSALSVVGGNAHAVGVTSMLTCRPFQEVMPTQFANVGWGGGISIDQELAKRIQGPPLQSLELGVEARRQGHDAFSFISYRDGGGSKNVVPPEDDPRNAWSRIFSSVPDANQTQATLQTIANKRKSVLDFVQGDYARVAAQLGASDRARLEQHATLLRELESSIAVVVPSCAKPAAPTFATSQLEQAQSYAAIGKAQMDLMAIALACDLVRVGSIQWTQSQSDMNYDGIAGTGLSVNGEVSHHGISHLAADSFYKTPDAQELSAMDKITQINTWFSQQLAYFAGQLAQLDDVGGTKVLDNTTILWVSEISEGPSHAYTDMPYVLLGSMGGAIKTNQHLAFGNKRNHNDLFITIGQAMGFSDLTTFGSPEFVGGPLTTLLV